MGQTTTLDLPHVVKVFAMVFWPITTFIPIKQSFHSIKSEHTKIINPRTCKNDQWKGVISFEIIRRMAEVILYHRFLLHIIEGTNSWRCSIRLQFAYPFVHPTKSHKHEHEDVCGFNCHLVLASMAKPIFPHQVHIRKVILPGFRSWWIGTMEFAPCFELSKE